MKTIIIDGIEYNLTPKVLFKKGDFVVIQETTYLISKIEGINVTLFCNGRECLFDIDVLKNARLWDITKDTKDGDVLCYENKNDFKIFIYKNGHIHYHCCYSNGHLSPVDSFFILQKHLLCYIQPATKEQRDLLFQEMKQSGYEWDAEKKELKKIESKTLDPDKVIEWINNQACLGFIEDIEVEKFVEQFKKDFGL